MKVNVRTSTREYTGSNTWDIQSHDRSWTVPENATFKYDPNQSVLFVMSAEKGGAIASFRNVTQWFVDETVSRDEE